MRRITITREVDAVSFMGRNYECRGVSPENRIKVLSALRSGRLDHLGPCQDISQGHHSTPQVYDCGQGHDLVAGAVSDKSQHIDIAWFLTPI